MREYKTVEEVRSYKTCSRVFCDICRAAGSAAVSEESAAEWVGDYYAVKRTVVRAEEGECYPEGGSTKTTRFDICLSCFNERLIPWFQSQGAEPAVTENDW
jgi:hypothetical protein